MRTLKIRRYEERDFRAYVDTLEKTTSWGDEAEEELAARIQISMVKARTLCATRSRDGFSSILYVDHA